MFSASVMKIVFAFHQNSQDKKLPNRKKERKSPYTRMPQNEIFFYICIQHDSKHICITVNHNCSFHYYLGVYLMWAIISL